MYNEKKHEQLIALGRKLEKGVTHKLDDPFVESILGTLQFFNASSPEMGQFAFDLKVAKYKIWDFLGMNYDSEYLQKQPVFVGLEHLVDLYIKMENLGGFAWFLRGHDLQCEKPKKCEDCIKSYSDWKNEQKNPSLAQKGFLESLEEVI